MALGRVQLHQDDGCTCGCGCGGSAPEGAAPLQLWEEAPDDTIVCQCAKVDKGTIVRAIRAGAFTAPLVKVLTGIGRGKPCPTGHECLRHLETLLALYGQTTLSDALVSLDKG